MERDQRFMNIVIQYTEECPNVDEAEERVRDVLRSLGMTAELRREVVRTADDAQRLSFPGSPTILVDGIDLFPTPVPTTGLVCRFYDIADGPIGTPSPEQLVDALKRRSEQR